MERFIWPSLRFNAPEYALVFDREFLDLPLKNRLIESPSAQPVGQWPNPDPVARATMGMIAEHIQYEAPTIQTTAAALGLQIRTFQRRLEQWGTTFESLLDDFRRERACALLQSGTCTIIEVAFRLGYSDSAHFTRAFHRWMGMAPREYLLRNHQRDHEAPHAKGRVLPSLFCS
jgi:AraC-like DNA-binding protein